MKKIIIGIVVCLIVIIGGYFIYTNRAAAAEGSFKEFMGNINKFDLSGTKNYIEDDGDLQKAITQINNYDLTRKQALEIWFKAVKANVKSAKKEDGETVLTVNFYSPNGTQIYNDFQYNLNGLDINSQTIQDSNLNGDFLEQQYSNAFSDAVEGNINNIKETTVKVKMKKTLNGWKIENDDQVMNGILGGLNAGDILN